MPEKKLPNPITPTGQLKTRWHVEIVEEDGLAHALERLSAQGFEIFEIDRSMWKGVDGYESEFTIIAFKREMVF